MSVEREIEFCEKGNFNKLQTFVMLASDEYAKCKLQKVLDTLRWASWNRDGILACRDLGGVSIPYAGIAHVKRYINKFAGDILEEGEQRKECGLAETIYHLKNNHKILLEVTDDPADGYIHFETRVINENEAVKNLLQYAKVAALQEIIRLTKDQVIKKYNGRYNGRDGSRIDRWCEPDNIFLFHGFYFKLLCDDQGRIIDLQEDTL